MHTLLNFMQCCRFGLHIFLLTSGIDVHCCDSLLRSIFTLLLLFENVLSLLLLELVSNSRGNKYPTRVISTWFIDRKDYLTYYQPRSRPLSLWKQGIKPPKDSNMQSLELTNRLIWQRLHFQYPGPWRYILDSLHNRVCRLEDTAGTTN